MFSETLCYLIKVFSDNDIPSMKQFASQSFSDYLVLYMVKYMKQCADFQKVLLRDLVQKIFGFLGSEQQKKKKQVYQKIKDGFKSFTGIYRDIEEDLVSSNKQRRFKAFEDSKELLKYHLKTTFDFDCQIKDGQAMGQPVDSQDPSRRIYYAKKVYKYGTYQGGLRSDGVMEGHGKYGWKDGTFYVGDWKNGKPHGKGKFSWYDATYEGDWIKGNMHGQGKYTWTDATFFEGSWKDGMMHGEGKYTWYDGTYYEGEFYKGDFHGKGIRTYVDGYYEGLFRHGKMHGHGRKTWNDGDWFEGEFKNGREHGEGELNWFDGTYYRGSWKKGDKWGHGKETYVDKSWYEGEWVRDTYEGKGTFVTKKGDMYVGEWRDGLKHGKGKMTYKDGRVEEGNWYEDRFVGGKDGVGEAGVDIPGIDDALKDEEKVAEKVDVDGVEAVVVADEDPDAVRQE